MNNVKEDIKHLAVIYYHVQADIPNGIYKMMLGMY